MTNEHAADLGIPREVAQDSGETTGTDIQPETSAVDDCGGLSCQHKACINGVWVAENANYMDCPYCVKHGLGVHCGRLSESKT